VVGLMYVALLFGSIVSALIFGWALTDFTPGRLIQVIQASAVATLVLNGVAVWKQEARGLAKLRQSGASDPSFRESWDCFIGGSQALRRLVAVGLGTLAFSMQDVMLEPYGGQILGLDVSDTTKLTAAMAGGGLVGFWLASQVLSRGADPFRMASYGALVGVPAFLMVIAAGPLNAPLLFGLGTLLVGFGAGLFGHGTLTATMNFAPPDQRGLALGAWGAVQATAAGIGVALGGIVRDLLLAATNATSPEMMPYVAVYVIEIVLLLTAIIVMLQLVRRPAILAKEHMG
jgi:MFS transporter, BCD family, chlorophyll transporter